MSWYEYQPPGPHEPGPWNYRWRIPHLSISFAVGRTGIWFMFGISKRHNLWIRFPRWVVRPGFRPGECEWAYGAQAMANREDWRPAGRGPGGHLNPPRNPSGSEPS